MKSIYFFLILFLTSFSIGLNAQVITTNTRGERIVKFPDGSWRYYVPADSILLKKDILNESSEKINQEATTMETQEVPVKIIVEKMIERLHSEISSLDEKLLDLTDKRLKAKENYEQALTAQGNNLRAIQILENKLTIIKQSISKLEKLKIENVNFLDELLAVKSLNKSAQKKVLLAYNIALNDVQKKSDISVVVNDYFLEQATKISSAIEVTDFSDKESSTIKQAGKPQVKIARPDIEIVEYGSHLLSRDCTLQKEDGSIGKGIEMKKQLFFTYTPEKLTQYYLKSSIMKCYAYFSYYRGLYNLHLIFNINSTQSDRAFGGIDKKSYLTIRTLDGDLYSFTAYNSDSGTDIAGTDHTAYHIIYQLSSRDARKLRNRSIDKVRVVWNKGYEDYTIYKVDLLKRQLQCLEEIL